ncbi:PLC-like phosphodiesterase [Acaromyces ingoldii]|uniref:PLC-like phosphodiesterase n=1 Tax=Acaromyces ingoldii TaxID=215250 RepID=A0A316YU80_9BASI|nr:PLC-like phosphodiesterase [Acaromyces ingoldii]PWN92616.1 PLC-like phosphodiesterase [Acaromyces ingoldii]
MSPPHAAKWMQTHRAQFGKRPLSGLTLPGSHDAGTYQIKFGTSAALESHVITQERSIYDQLGLGVRRFDIRPTLASENDETKPSWNSGHYSNTTIGWQGASCTPIDDIVVDVNNFTSENAELIVLDVSHVQAFQIHTVITDQRGASEADWLDLMERLSKIERLFTMDPPERNKKALQTYDVDTFIGNNKAAVIVLVEDCPYPDQLFAHRLWPKTMSNGQEFLDSSGTSINRPQDTEDAIFATLKTPLESIFGNSSSALSIAQKLQEEKFPDVLQKAIDGLPANLATDRIINADLLTFCIAIMYLKLNIAQGLDGNKIVVYGGALITDAKVHDRIQQAIDKGTSFEVSNDNLGTDPWPGLKKSCGVYYKQNGQIKGRWAPEFSALLFS